MRTSDRKPGGEARRLATIAFYMALLAGAMTYFVALQPIRDIDRYFPVGVLLMLAAATIASLVISLRRQHDPKPEGTLDTGPRALRRAGALIAVALAYPFAIQYIGLIPASLAAFPLMSQVSGRLAWWVTLLIAAGFAAFAAVAFVLVLGYPLPLWPGSRV